MLRINSTTQGPWIPSKVDLEAFREVNLEVECAEFGLTVRHGWDWTNKYYFELKDKYV